jgi:hypothetical protein
MSTRPKRAGAGIARPVFDPSSVPKSKAPAAPSVAAPKPLKVEKALAAPKLPEVEVDARAVPIASAVANSAVVAVVHALLLPAAAAVPVVVAVIVPAAAHMPAPDMFANRAAAALAHNGTDNMTAGRAKSEFALVRGARWMVELLSGPLSPTRLATAG